MLSLEVTCYYLCWCSVLCDLAIPADSWNISLGMGMSNTLKARVKLLRWLWWAVAQWSDSLQLKQEALGLIPSGCPGGSFFSSSWLTNINKILKPVSCAVLSHLVLELLPHLHTTPPPPEAAAICYCCMGPSNDKSWSSKSRLPQALSLSLAP